MDNEDLHEIEKEDLTSKEATETSEETPATADAAPVVQQEEQADVTPPSEGGAIDEVKQKLSREAELRRHKAELLQLEKDQKAEHKKRDRDAQWERYGEKLKKVGFKYVPNPVLLVIVLAVDGLVGLINSLGAILTAVVKALKWVLIPAAIIGVLWVIPATREWLLTLLQYT